MDGIETTQRIRAGELGESLARIPIVALTAFTREEDRAKFRQAGMDAYLSKPVKVEELEQILANLVPSATDSPSV